jgi:polyphosphate kinase
MTTNPLLAEVGPGEELPGFDIDDPELPPKIAERALRSGDYPYDKRMKRKRYERELEQLQVELLKLQYWVREQGRRLVIIFEGRDAAGKGGTILRFMQHLPPREVRAVALPKPSDVERTQWYFQRYVAQLPSAGETLLFDRSWYNRAVVEPVMGFCTQEQTDRFLEECPKFEQALVRDRMMLFKIWLTVGREMQLKRLHSRRHHPLKRWKLGQVDIDGLTKWDAYTAAIEKMFKATDRPDAPWMVVRANDKRRTRLNAMRAVLSQIDYTGKDADIATPPDPQIVGGPDLLLSPAR